MIEPLLGLVAHTLDVFVRPSFLALAVAAALWWAIMFNSVGGWIFFACVAVFAMVRWLRVHADRS